MNSKSVLWIGILSSVIFIIFCIVTKYDQIYPNIPKTTVIESTVKTDVDQKPLFIDEPIEVEIEQNRSKNFQTLIHNRPISFEKGSAKLSKEGKLALDEIIKLIKDPNSTLLYVNIDTDDTKSLTLTKQRAKSVKEYLSNKGIKIKDKKVEIILKKDTK